MIKKEVIGLLVLLVLVNIVAATDTLVEIKTIQSGDVTLRVRDDTGKIIPGAIYDIIADSTGLASYVYTGPESIIKLSASVKGVTFNGVETVFFNDPLLTGKKIYVDLTQAEPTAVLMDLPSEEGAETGESGKESEMANETESEGTANETEEVVEEPEEEPETTSETESKDAESSGITGLTVLTENKTITYSVFILVIVAVLVFFFILFYNKKVKSSGLIASLSRNSHERQLRDAERKIKKAQEELNRIRNIDKIKAAEEKLRKDKETLGRLRRGQDA